jgi:hypothetical protein
VIDPQYNDHAKLQGQPPLKEKDKTKMMTVLQLNQIHTSRISWRTFYHRERERERERDQAFRQHIGRMYMLQTARSEPPKHAYLDSFISISTVVAAIYGVP